MSEQNIACDRSMSELNESRPPFSSLGLRRLVAVLPRYGADLGGGAETLVRHLLLHIQATKELETIEVWTTCAKDHRTWENFHPPGVTQEDNFVVRRFSVDERNLDIFIRAELALAAGKPLTLSEQFDWLANGVNSRGLYEHIANNAKKFDLLLFAPYLFSTTFWGAMLAPERSALIPCLHNEAYAYLEVFRVLFRQVKGLIFNAHPEQELAAALYGKETVSKKGQVVGMGFVPGNSQGEREVAPAKNPYVIYSGRKEQGKNLDKLIDWFVKARLEIPDLELVLIGSGRIEFLETLPEGVRDLGFVSESEKLLLMKQALCLCQPSVNESFSIVIMEAWLEGVPVLVHADCDVTKDHVQRSGGGFYCRDWREFKTIITELLQTPGMRESLGAAGKKYVENVYDWERVLERFAEALRRFDLPNSTSNLKSLSPCNQETSALLGSRI